MTHPSIKYAEDVLSGKILACKWVILACERFISDLENADSLGIYFDADEVDRVIRFYALCPHFKGEWAGLPMILEPWQIFILANVFGWKWKKTNYRRFKVVYVTVARKNGKGLALDTKLPTPNGWTDIGSIKVGDTLFDDKGSQCLVTFVSNKRLIDCYKMTFSNGESIICDGDHLWETTARVINPGSNAIYPRIKSDKKSVRDTREIFKTQRYSKRNDVNHSIDMPLPIECTVKDLPIDPYVFGVWLGDGSSSCARVTCSENDIAEMKNSIEQCGYKATITQYAKRASSILIQKNNNSCARGHDEAYRVNGKCRECARIVKKARKLGEKLPPKTNLTVHELLKKMGVLNDKHIPDLYLRASFTQRLALLQGLMDTDGTCDKRGRAQEFCTISKRLLNGVCELLSTLGIKYSVREKPKRCNGKLIGGIAYYVQFCCLRDILPVFRLKRKLNRQKTTLDRTVKPRSRTIQIVSVEKIKQVPTKCIQVDSPNKLFLCGRTMIPTHNTSMVAPAGLYLMTGDNEPGAEIYSAAVDRDQAREIFDAAKAMVELGQLSRAITTFSRNMCIESTRSKFEPLSADEKKQHGKNIHAALCDELHVWPKASLWSVLRTGMGSRRQPIQWAITTAGSDQNTICYEIHDYTQRVLKGFKDRSFIDDTFFGIIYCLDRKQDWPDLKTDEEYKKEGGVKEDDWQDQKVWIKANPNLGVSVKLKDLEDEARTAVQMPASQNDFLRLRMNIWTQQVTRWISLELWDANYSNNVYVME